MLFSQHNIKKVTLQESCTYKFAMFNLHQKEGTAKDKISNDYRGPKAEGSRRIHRQIFSCNFTCGSKCRVPYEPGFDTRTPNMERIESRTMEIIFRKCRHIEVVREFKVILQGFKLQLSELIGPPNAPTPPIFHWRTIIFVLGVIMVERGSCASPH